MPGHRQGAHLILLLLAAGFRMSSVSVSSAEPHLEAPERGFLSSQPGETWEKGLICGNGTIGANMLGQPLEETVVFTHERLFLPMGPPTMPPDTSARLFEVRRLIDRGLYQQAAQLAFDLSGQAGFMYPDPFVPAFDLNIKMTGETKVSNYMRSVNFQTGEAVVHWTGAKGPFERRLFVSRADGVAVLSITGPGKVTVNCRLQLAPRTPRPKVDEKKRERSAARYKEHITELEIAADATGLTWRNTFAKAYPGSIQALEGVARVVAENGKVAPQGDTLTVSGADRVLVLLDIKPIYKLKHSLIDQTRKELAALGTDYGRLLEAHARLHSELFNRMRLDLGGQADHALTTEALLAKSTREAPLPALIEKEFDAGRYNIISCTGELPPTLQGVWAGDYVPSWASDFTQNGNVPSAIASMMMGNTPELMRAYTSYIESLVPYLEINAKHIFGARGIVLPSRTSTHGFNNALAPRFAGGMWVAGAAWAAHFFYDYYLYTGDRDFLARHALPFMEKAALFFEDYLYEGPDGKYVFNPTSSPENSPGNTHSQATFNATMDVAAAKELLTNLIAGSRVLEVNKEKIPVWQAMLDKMPDYMIDEELGVLKEWLTPKLKDNLGHRHSSHLYALYDGMPAEFAGSAKLRAAARRIIEYKLDKHFNRSGFMSFGVVQLGLAASSLGEGELAYDCLRHLANRYWLANLASMHNQRSLFNMDISGGMPAVIIKMLVASAPGRIQLLPAFPSAWPQGAIEGVLCRGQIQIHRLQWGKGWLLVDLVSGVKQTVEIDVPAAIESVEVKRGRASVKKSDRERCRRVSLRADESVALEIRLKK